MWLKTINGAVKIGNSGGRYLLLSLYQSDENDSTVILKLILLQHFSEFSSTHTTASNAIIFLRLTIFFFRRKLPYPLSWKTDFPSVEESFFISSLLSSFLKQVLSPFSKEGRFLRFFTSLKFVVFLSARSLISDETAQSRGKGLFSYKGNQAAIQMCQFRFHRQLRRSWRRLLMVPICRLLHVLMFLL